MKQCSSASFVWAAAIGLAITSCRESPPPDQAAAPAAQSDLTRIDALVPHLPGFLGSEGVTILSLTNDTTAFLREIIVHVSLPDSVNLRNWERFQGFYRRAWSALDGNGRFVLADRLRKVRIEFDLSDNQLDIEDSTGYFLPPRPPVFSQGSDRIQKTPSDAGMYEDEPNENGTYHGVRCNGLQDVNGRLYYNMSGFSFQVDDEESGTGHTASSPPHLVDAITREIWRATVENVWVQGKGMKTRLLMDFAATFPQNWQVVADKCEENGYFWQYQLSSRKLEMVSLESLEAVVQERLPAGIRGEVVSIREWNSPGDTDYQALSLVRDGDRFTVLRSRGDTMFAQRWDPPQPEDTRYIFLSPGSDPKHFSFDDKEYGIDEIEWVDLVSPPASRQKPASEDDVHSL